MAWNWNSRSVYFIYQQKWATMNYVKVATCIVLLISTSINAIAQSNQEDNTFYTKFIFYLSLFLSLLFSILLYKLKNKDVKRSSLELAIWLSERYCQIMPTRLVVGEIDFRCFSESKIYEKTLKNLWRVVKSDYTTLNLKKST